jgi:toxin YoeB
MRTVEFTANALSALQFWLKSDRKILDRIFTIIEETRREPFKGIGKPEPLKNNLKGYWSRRINDEHRMIYKVTEDNIIIFSLKGHYE